ncbi:MAG: hypothetical protein MUF10_15985 [Thermoanaerobaculaceae bacterium]|nr:hypothetical protein [Thermoanaerobaculaceae bacterium]
MPRSSDATRLRATVRASPDGVPCASITRAVKSSRSDGMMRLSTVQMQQSRQAASCTQRAVGLETTGSRSSEILGVGFCMASPPWRSRGGATRPGSRVVVNLQDPFQASAPRS